MKHAITTVAVGLMFIMVCAFADAQQKPDAESGEYAQLKVLEPLVGTYRSEWTNQESGDQGESNLTISWNDSKNMLIAESQYRTIASDTNRPKTEWMPAIRLYFVWNHVGKRIESIDVQAWSGVVNISEVTAKDGGVLSLAEVRTTGRPGGSASISLVAAEHDLTVKITNIKSPAGETLDDMEFKFIRVKQQ